jgi:hypothetical protein
VTSTLTSPWPEYAAAHVEIATQQGRLLLRPEGSGTPVTGPTSGWSALTVALGVPAGTLVSIVTASNPYPLELDDDANARRARQLEAELDRRGLRHVDALARSPDGSSCEVSRAIIGASREQVREIAQHFEQLAVFEFADVLACVETATGRVVTVRPYLVGPAER